MPIIRQLAKGQADDLALALAQNVQLDGAAGCEAADDAGEFAGILDRLAIHRSDDVARLDAGLCCRSVLLRVSYQRTLRLLQAHAVGDILGYRLNLNTDPAAADVPLSFSWATTFFTVVAGIENAMPTLPPDGE